MPTVATHLFDGVEELDSVGPWPWRQTIDQVQVPPKQIPRHSDLGQFERDIATMADNLGSNLDQLLSKRVQ